MIGAHFGDACFLKTEDNHEGMLNEVYKVIALNGS